MLHNVLNKRCKSGHLYSDFSGNSVCLSLFFIMFAVGLLYGISFNHDKHKIRICIFFLITNHNCYILDKFINSK